ncbi:hypothetical protein NUSPORA_01396 [Nucleospora cyclopteri]
MPSLHFYCDNKNFKNRTIKRKKESEKKQILTVIDNKIVVDETGRDEGSTEIVTSGTYVKKNKSTSKWPKKATELFYKALSVCGCDFSLIKGIFADKSRKSLKMKFIKEERANKKKIDEFLKNCKEFDNEKYEKLKEEYKYI